MGKVILFTRVSTQQQHLESQEDSLRRAAIADGFSEDQMIVIGTKESAIKLEEEERQGLQELKKELAKGDVNIIYIFELSRLSRKPKVLYSIRDQLLEAKVQLKCLNPSFTLLNNDRTQFDSTASLIFSLFGAMAEQEMIEKKERFHRGRRRLAEEGKYNGGNIPYGYKIDREHGKLIVIDEADAAVVREIFNLYESGVSQPQLAKEFYRRGNRKITISFLNNILNNERYTGRKHCYPGSSFERVYPVIITPEQFDRCRKIALENNTTANKARYIYYAHKLIRCKQCGCFWSASGSKAYYHCYDAFNTMRKYDHYSTPQCTNKIGISINILDSILWHLCIKEEVRYIVNAANAEVADYKERVAVLEQKLSFIDGRLKLLDEKKERIVETYIDGSLSKEKRDQKFAEVDRDRKDILLEQVEYLNEKEHLEGLMVDLSAKYNLDDVSNIAGHLDRISALQERIASITSDKERSEIIHRHVKSVTVENREIMYAFGIGTRMAMARLITITFYRGETEYFYYLPNTGKGGIVLRADENEKVIEKMRFQYLPRFFDEGKDRRHREEREEKKKTKEALYPAAKYVMGYRLLGEFLNINLATAFNYTKDGNVLAPARVAKYNKAWVFDKRLCIKLLKKAAESDVWMKKVYDNIPDENKKV